jgi:hypothetical protein
VSRWLARPERLASPPATGVRAGGRRGRLICGGGAWGVEWRRWAFSLTPQFGGVVVVLLRERGGVNTHGCPSSDVVS